MLSVPEFLKIEVLIGVCFVICHVKFIRSSDWQVKFTKASLPLSKCTPNKRTAQGLKSLKDEYRKPTEDKQTTVISPYPDITRHEVAFCTW